VRWSGGPDRGQGEQAGEAPTRHLEPVRHLEQINEITADGMPVLIPPDSSRRANKPKRSGWNGGAYHFMRSVLSTPLGAELYKQRAQLIEPIFGNTKHNRGFIRFHRAPHRHHPQSPQAPPTLHPPAS
jgi:hypothetical protein